MVIEIDETLVMSFAATFSLLYIEHESELVLQQEPCKEYLGEHFEMLPSGMN